MAGNLRLFGWIGLPRLSGFVSETIALAMRVDRRAVVLRQRDRAAVALRQRDHSAVALRIGQAGRGRVD